ncbi:MAG TPA: LecA/PA-IL family lectin [Pyrinomonadaceae bacterium]|jgi:hypothetical protein
MHLKSGFFRLFCSLCLVFSMSVLAFADTIRLKDGSVIKGKIVNFTGGKFTVAMGEGSRRREMSFSADDIESIQFDATQTPAETVKISNQNVGVKTNENNIIPVEQNRNLSTSPVAQPETVKADNTTQVDTVPNTNTGVAKSKPIELNVKVLADNTANGWSNSGWVVKKGQKIRIAADGRVSLGSGRFTTASGIATLPDDGKLMKNVPTGALIVVIGDDNNEFIYIGAEREFVAARDGSLFLGVNEGNLNDNSGAFDVKIEIDSSSGK